MRTLLHKNMVCGLSQLSASSVTCTDCINGKQHQDRIPKKSTWRATQKLELIHADICGLITPTSNSNNKRYILIFIDDNSRKAWVYFLVEKSEALNFFKCFKTMVKKKQGYLLSAFALIEEENSIQMSSMIFANKVGSRGS